MLIFYSVFRRWVAIPKTVTELNLSCFYTLEKSLLSSKCSQVEFKDLYHGYVDYYRNCIIDNQNGKSSSISPSVFAGATVVSGGGKDAMCFVIRKWLNAAARLTAKSP